MVEAGEYEIGPASGDLLVKTRSAGMAATLGHDLTLIVDDWSGTLTMADDVAGCAVQMSADLRSLRVVDGRGGAKPLTDRDRADIVKNAQKALATSTHPTLALETQSVIGTWVAATCLSLIELHGVTRGVELFVEQPDTATFRAMATIRQSDFGIKPYSAMLGAIRIADDVEVEVVVGF